jgi:alpha-tubulin suppressor-like RCC1 family protein
MPEGVGAFSMISAGFNHTCALASGAAYCWGNNEHGQLGTGAARKIRPYPYAVIMTEGVSFLFISAGKDHTCAISTTGAAYCWGSDQYGQVGLNRTDALDFTYPRAVRMPTGVAFMQIGAGWYHNCALGNNSYVYCWGLNIAGQLGVGDNTPRYRPTAVSGGVGYLTVSSKYYHSCAISQTYAAYCWGVNTNGELGTNDQFNKLVPTAVSN